MKKRVSAVTVACREAWAITEPAFKVVLSVASRGELFNDERKKALADLDGREMVNARTVDNRGGVAVIPIQGPLVRHASAFDDISGATSYDDLREDFDAAMADRDVHAILFAVDSPGGEVTGVADLADAIVAARGNKPIHAHVEGLGASAAYWLASACDRITCSDTAELGSIGVRMAMIDDTEAEKMAGIRTVNFVSSASPHKMTDLNSNEDLARVQKRVNALGDIFVERVAMQRGVAVGAVREHFGQGDVLIGREAVAVGMADDTSTFEAALSELGASTPGARIMKFPQMAATLGLAENATEAQIQDRVATLAKTEQKILATTGAADIDTAIGAIVANKEAAAKLDALSLEHAKLAAAATTRDFRAALESAVSENRVTLGALAMTIPSMLDEGEKAATALDAMPEQTASAVIDALCSVNVSQSDLRRVASYCGRQKASVLPATRKEPAHDPKKALLTEEDKDIDAIFAAARGK